MESEPNPYQRDFMAQAIDYLGEAKSTLAYYSPFETIQVYESARQAAISAEAYSLAEQV